jgi:hypothetical protein
MPTIEVSVNGKSIALAGGEGFDLLSLSVLNSKDSADAVVLLTGRRETDEVIQWLNTRVMRGDEVTIVLRYRGAATTEPDALPSWPVQGNNGADQSKSSQPSASSFTVRYGAHVARVSADSTGTLLVAATWKPLYGKCKLEVTRLPEKDSDPNRCWIEFSVDFDEPVLIKIG